MPERSQANLDALARVELTTYEMPQADGIEVEYGVYVPTAYNDDRSTPLVIALHGVGSGTMYMMEYNNLVELAEEYGFIVATPMGFNERDIDKEWLPVSDFVEKPVDLNVLKDKVHALLHPRENSNAPPVYTLPIKGLRRCLRSKSDQSCSGTESRSISLRKLVVEVFVQMFFTLGPSLTKSTIASSPSPTHM